MAFDAFLKIQGIPGESADEAHKDCIEVLGYSHGMTQAATGHGRAGGAPATGRCNLGDFTVTKRVDKATTLLAKALCMATLIKEVKLELCRAGGSKEKYMEYTLSNVIVSSVTASKSREGEGLPEEHLAFSFGKMTWTYFRTDPKTGKPKGELEHTYDLTCPQ